MCLLQEQAVYFEVKIQYAAFVCPIDLFHNNDYNIRKQRHQNLIKNLPQIHQIIPQYCCRTQILKLKRVL